MFFVNSPSKKDDKMKVKLFGEFYSAFLLLCVTFVMLRLSRIANSRSIRFQMYR